jgi:hypothetical protein
MYLAALDNQHWSGPFNATAPEPVTNQEFAHALGRVLHRPALLAVPAFALRALYGEMASVVTTGQRALPVRALERDFEFQHTAIDGALRAAMCDRSHNEQSQVEQAERTTSSDRGWSELTTSTALAPRIVLIVGGWVRLSRRASARRGGRGDGPFRRVGARATSVRPSGHQRPEIAGSPTQRKPCKRAASRLSR